MTQTEEPDEPDDESAEELSIAAGAARRLVSQCRAHVESVNRKLGGRISNAAPDTPCGIDFARAKASEHRAAFEHNLKRIESLNNALASHLRGLHVLLDYETFYPLPAMTIARSIAEVSGSASWLVHPGITADDRAARNYAALFAILDKGISFGDNDDPERTRKVKEDWIADLKTSQPTVRVIRRVKDGVARDDIAQVMVGSAHAKTRFPYSQRLSEEIPMVGALYAQMSAATHGEQTAVSASFLTPASYARGIAHVALESTKAWSIAVHSWTGAIPGQFWNDIDLRYLRESVPAARRAELTAEIAERLSPDTTGSADDHRVSAQRISEGSPSTG